MNKFLKYFQYGALVVACAFAFLGCDYARMSDQESFRPYETSFPDMPLESVPVTGSIQSVKEMDPEELHNPTPYSPESVQRGKEKYGFFCIMCHGPKVDGYGTVGQSFYPLPTDLRERHVQNQTDGELFHSVSFGLNRHPPLAYTVPEADRWDIINFIRSLVDNEIKQ